MSAPEAPEPIRRQMGRESGEHPFLDSLARKYRTALDRFFERRVRDVDGEGEDLTQEVFVRLARRQGEEIDSIEGYIFQTASSVLTDRARRRTVRLADQHDQYEEDRHAIADFSPERVLLAKEQLQVVKDVLNQLPERVRGAFVLHRFEGLGYHEIARRLGVSVSSVQKYVARALLELTAARQRDET